MNRQTRRQLAPVALTETRRRIAAIRRLNIANKTVDDLKVHLRPLMDKLPTRLMEFRPGGALWRGVAWDIRPTKPSELSHPPASRIKSYQRANRPEQPRFYCSVGGYAPFYELRMEVGQYLALSKWRVRQLIVANHIGYTAANFDRLGAKRQLPPAWDGVTQTPATAMAHNFLAELFCRDVQIGYEDQYKFSVAIAELFTAGTEDFRINALTYPALAAKGNHDNVVMFPEIADRHLELEQAIYFRITAIEPDLPRYHAEELAIATSFDSQQIHWIDQAPRAAIWEPSKR